MSSLIMANQEASPVLVCLNPPHRLDFLSALTHQSLKSLSFPSSFAYSTFQGRTYILQCTGQVDIYDTATQILIESISAPGLSQVSDLLVIPSCVYSLQAGSYLTFEKRVWEQMVSKHTNLMGNVQSCYMEGETYVALSMSKPNPCSWCMNCRGTYVYETALYKLERGDDLTPLKVELCYGKKVPFLLPYSQSELILVGGGLVGPVAGIYRLNMQTLELQWLGESPIEAWVSAACIYRDRLYTIYEDGSFLSVSVETGMGWTTLAAVWKYVWVIKKRFPRVTSSILHVVLSLFTY